MVHGAFCGAWAWDSFRAPFEAAGHVVAAPDLPGHAPDDPPRAVAGRSMSDFAQAVADVCDAQPSPPVLIGHSIGGLVAQLAAARTRLSGLILLAPSPPWGIQGASFGEAAQAGSLAVLGPASWFTAVDPDYPTARAWLFDAMATDDRRSTFHRMKPESGRALWETIAWWLDPFATTFVGPASARQPSLAIAGERDGIHPPSAVAAVARRLDARSEVAAGMGHWLIGEPGWERVAATCLKWIGSLPGAEAAVV